VTDFTFVKKLRTAENKPDEAREEKYDRVFPLPSSDKDRVSPGRVLRAGILRALKITRVPVFSGKVRKGKEYLSEGGGPGTGFGHGYL